MLVLTHENDSWFGLDIHPRFASPDRIIEKALKNKKKPKKPKHQRSNNQKSIEKTQKTKKTKNFRRWYEDAWMERGCLNVLLRIFVFLVLGGFSMLFWLFDLWCFGFFGCFGFFNAFSIVCTWHQPYSHENIDNVIAVTTRKGRSRAAGLAYIYIYIYIYMCVSVPIYL